MQDLDTKSCTYLVGTLVCLHLNSIALQSLVGNMQNQRSKVKAVQEPCVKRFAVHILKFEILQNTLKKMKKMKQRTSDSSILMLFVLFFHVV